MIFLKALAKFIIFGADLLSNLKISKFLLIYIITTVALTYHVSGIFPIEHGLMGLVAQLKDRLRESKISTTNINK